MDVQGTGQQGKCARGLGFDLASELFLEVLVSTFLNSLPREITAIGKQI